MRRIAFIYNGFNMPNPINPNEIFSSSRGLTGSEMAWLMYSIEMQKLGNDVTMFANFTHPGDVGDITCVPFHEWEEVYCNQKWDVVITFMSSEPLRHVKHGETLRLFNQQNPIFNPSEREMDFVDFLLPLSHSHANYLSGQSNFDKRRYRVMYNGVDNNAFDSSGFEKKRNKLIWASSHDRGLHWLLEIYPELKMIFPDITLDIYYGTHGLQSYVSNPDSVNRELLYRARYILNAIEKLKDFGVTLKGSVSREDMAVAMKESWSMVYPLDPIHYTESFGVSVLEACSCGTVPVICGADAFDELWSPVCLISPAPYSDNKNQFLSNVFEILECDEKTYEEYSNRCINYARKFNWKDLAVKFNEFINDTSTGLEEVNWS
jgi:glycosyltransferase involved in cell wall biosynthesis